MTEPHVGYSGKQIAHAVLLDTNHANAFVIDAVGSLPTVRLPANRVPKNDWLLSGTNQRLPASLERIHGHHGLLRTGSGLATSCALTSKPKPPVRISASCNTPRLTHLRAVLGDQTYESLARKGGTMTTSAMVA